MVPPESTGAAKRWEARRRRKASAENCDDAGGFEQGGVKVGQLCGIQARRRHAVWAHVCLNVAGCDFWSLSRLVWQETSGSCRGKERELFASRVHLHVCSLGADWGHRRNDIELARDEADGVAAWHVFSNLALPSIFV
jgi:hypothetical protein